MKGLYALILALPELMAIWREINQMLKDGRTAEEIKAHRKKMINAIETKDIDAINHLFNNG